MSAFKQIKGVAMAIAGLAIIAAQRFWLASAGGLDNAPEKHKRPDAGKRKAAKRARRASKRAIMYRKLARGHGSMRIPPMRCAFRDLIGAERLATRR